MADHFGLPLENIDKETITRLGASNALLVEALENFTRNSVGYPNFLEYYHQGTECEGPESCAHCLAVTRARAALESAKTV
jgi:hypothetical protein